jgi:hypothetical protein
VLSNQVTTAVLKAGFGDLGMVLNDVRRLEKVLALFYEESNTRPRVDYGYTLQVEGLSETFERNVEVNVSEIQQGMYRGSFAATLEALVVCPLVSIKPWLAPGCAFATSLSKTLYLAAYGEVALNTALADASVYTELVQTQPITLTALTEFSDPAEHVYIQQRIEAEAHERAALESLRRAQLAIDAGDIVWSLRQRQHARDLLEQAATHLDQASEQAAASLVDEPPLTADEIAELKAALAANGFGATIDSIFTDVGLTTTEQEDLKAQLLALPTEDWPEITTVPAATSVYRDTIARLAQIAEPTLYLPLVRR